MAREKGTGSKLTSRASPEQLRRVHAELRQRKRAERLAAARAERAERRLKIELGQRAQPERERASTPTAIAGREERTKTRDEKSFRAISDLARRGQPGAKPLSEIDVQAAGLDPRSLDKFGRKFVGNLADVATHAPAGLYETGKVLGGDVVAALPGTAGTARFRDSRTLAKQIAASTYQDLRHPLRNPGYTALTLLGLASAGAGTAVRAGAAANAARAGGVRGAVTRASSEGGSLLHAPNPGARIFRTGDLEVAGLYSRNPLARSVQKLGDRKREEMRARDGRLGYVAERTNTRRVGQALAEERRTVEAIERAPAAGLAQQGKRLTTPQETAIRVVAEGKPIDARINAHLRDMAGASPRERNALGKKIQLLKGAARYVEDVDGKPQLRSDFAKPRIGGKILPRGRVGPEELRQLYDRAAGVARERERTLTEAGALDPAQITSRRDAPGRVIEGKDSTFTGGDFRVPYSTRRPPASQNSAAAYRGGIPRKPSSVSQSFTGGLLRKGNYRDATSRVVAESGVEAQRYAGLVRLRGRIIKAARDTPGQTGTWVPIRLDALKSKPIPPEVRRLMEKADEGVKLSHQEQRQIGDAYDTFRQEVFPAQPVEGVKWVDERLLEKVNKPTAQPGRAAKAALATLDSVNNAQRAAILYLKPAYAVPNLLGNAAMNLMQQGFAAPANLTRAVLVGQRISPDALATLDSVMGEGAVRSLAGEGGVGTRAIQGLASVWSKGVDLPFRRASFLYEARRAGFGGPKKIDTLLTDPKHRDVLIETSKRANRAVVDFGRLGPAEREIVRRVIFFYPWLKGSAMYTGHVLREHPIQSAALGQLGEQAAEQAQEDLGARPTYAKGLHKVGERGGNALATNMGTLSPFTSAIDAGRVAKGLVMGGAGPTESLSQSLTPALGAALAALNRRDSFTGRELKGGAPEIFARELVNSTPQALLVKRWREADGDQSQKLYPYSKLDAGLQFGLGAGVAPRPVNVAVLNKKAREEGEKDRPPEQRGYRKVFEERKRFHNEAARVAGDQLVGGKLPKRLRFAFNLEAERQGAIAKAREGTRRSTVEFHRAGYEANLSFLVRHKIISSKQARDVLIASRGASMDALSAANRGISEKYFQSETYGGQLHVISTARRALKELGAEGLD